MSTENAIASAIRSGGKIDYFGSDNVLNGPCIRVQELGAACLFIKEACEAGTGGESLPGIAVVLDLIAGELARIGVGLDDISAEICRAVNGEPIWTPEGVQP